MNFLSKLVVILAACLASSVVGGPAVASAEDDHQALGSSVGAPASDQAREWYGGTMVALDLAAFGVIGGGGLLAAHDHLDVGGVLAVAGMLTLLLGGPIVHHVERNDRTSVRSFLLRFGACGIGAIVGGVIGTYATRGNDFPAGLAGFLEGVIIGEGIGLVLGAGVDDAFWAWKPVKASRSAMLIAPL